MKANIRQRMHDSARTIKAWLKIRTTTDWIAFALFMLFTLTFSTLLILKYHSFDIRALDTAKFDQAIWNTSQGRPFEITLTETSVIKSHFSPALALFAPLYWLWSDIRVLFIAQSLLVAGTGLWIYLSMRSEHPWLGLAVFAAFLFHPSTHQIMLIAFRRWTLAMFCISWALYLMLRERHKAMLIPLAIALLCKEDIAFTVICVGLYVWLKQRKPALGIGLTVFGVAYLFIIPWIVLPALNASHRGYVHARTNYGYLGSSLEDMLSNIVTQPQLLFSYALRADRLTVLFKFFWPTLFIFLLAPELAAFMLPNLAYLLTSTVDRMGLLQYWYPSIILIYMFWAVAVGVRRLPKKTHTMIAAGLVIAGLAGWFSYSQLWPGPAQYLNDFTVTNADWQAHQALAQIPTEVSVLAQEPLVAHVAHRENVLLITHKNRTEITDYVAINMDLSTYPYSAETWSKRAYRYLASPQYPIINQVDDFYLFAYAENAPIAHQTDHTWNDLITLTGYSIDVAADNTSFALTDLPQGTQAIRVTLHWRMDEVTDTDYTVFVHLIDAYGNMLTQHDSWPADNNRPTSELELGEEIRDLHFLTWEHGHNPADLFVRIGLYNYATGENLLLPDSSPFIVVPVVE